MSKELKQIQLSEVEKLKLENVELKKRALEQQYNSLEQQKRTIIEEACKAHNCKVEDIESIDLDNGAVKLK